MTLGACATPADRELSRQAPVGAFLSSGARPANPDQYDPRLARRGVIGAMEQALGRPIQVLELSGGGQYGAFGAGFLNGWSTTGTRPQFDLVTGISTGALLATHAFLGTPADDRTLKRLYTDIDQRDIYRGVSLPADIPISGKPLAFDRDEMRRVFEAGYQLGREPDPWLHRPPPSDQLGPWTIRLFEHLDRIEP